MANQLLVQAEKFKARVEAPKGKQSFNDVLMPYDYDKLRTQFVRPEGLSPIDNEILFLRNFDQDDEFFQITSQIDANLKLKIEQGEFVELERLLPKDRNNKGGDDLNRQLFQLITQGKTPTWNLLYLSLAKLTASENGTRHSECMPPSTLMLILVGHLKSGSMYMSYTLPLQQTPGTMYIFTTLTSES